MAQWLNISYVCQLYQTNVQKLCSSSHIICMWLNSSCILTYGEGSVPSSEREYVGVNSWVRWACWLVQADPSGTLGSQPSLPETFFFSSIFCSQLSLNFFVRAQNSHDQEKSVFAWLLRSHLIYHLICSCYLAGRGLGCYPDFEIWVISLDTIFSRGELGHAVPASLDLFLSLVALLSILAALPPSLPSTLSLTRPFISLSSFSV